MNFEHFFWITIVFGTNRNNEIGVRTHRFDCHVCFFFYSYTANMSLNVDLVGFIEM